MGWVHDFGASAEAPPDERVRLLGGKGANLVVMATELGLPVPPGFTVTTEACREYFARGWPVGLGEELRAAMARLGERVGRRFGDPVNPLLVSVRSGAPVSMPGMMDTLLDLGLTDATVDGVARSTGSPDFASDCLRRLRQGWKTVTGSDDLPHDPWVQLLDAVEAVFRSWNSDRAKAYRAREGISPELGTAVTVQAMVFGNRGPNSGTGVLFTRNPATGERDLYGDVLFNAQGEDVVAGTHTTEPIAVLDSRLPGVAAELRRHADMLERHLRAVADIEFTIEDGRLWLLQVRTGKLSPRAALRTAIDMADDPGFPLTRAEAIARVAHLLADPPRLFRPAADAAKPMTSGLPASPGVAWGAIALTAEAAEAAAAAGKAVILVREETSPQDVRGMSRAAGVLTARGGLASHAAVVARGWGIPAVVGAEEVRPADRAVAVGGRSFAAGEVITIDGSTGAVYAGELAGAWEVVPEAATLRGWAAELGIDLHSEPPEQAAIEQVAANEVRSGALSAGDVLQALAIKGTVAVDALADAVGARPENVATMIVELDGLVERAGADIRLSAPGKLAAAERFAMDRSAVGEARSGELLEQFHAFDSRMKEIVTAWQVREVAAEQVLNDHADVAYDGSVLERLAALHTELARWLTPLADRLRRFDAYRGRLARALERARGGDQRYVASPRVDSYHSVWFELHEDLIRLAGRKRSDFG